MFEGESAVVCGDTDDVEGVAAVAVVRGLNHTERMKTRSVARGIYSSDFDVQGVELPRNRETHLIEVVGKPHQFRRNQISLICK